ncbi:MAG TPA: SH3 domain-containing protein, partial [Treponemataceae bacterium]|nr:SH3 domain-containing protein [Treponemataceae bacterium]
MKLKARIFIPILITGILLSSCSHVMGYSVLLWSLPEKNISDGEIVPVYILSNISNVYVIGLPGTDEKIEVPLWQLTPPESKKKAAEKKNLYVEYQHRYAKVTFDGLPMRSEAVNTSKQVYRLRKGEIIKILYKGEGQTPMTGKKALSGDWLKVMASDGTVGWCFSYNLQLFDEREQNIVIEQEEKTKDVLLEKILAKSWWPEQYGPLIASNTINLEIIKSEYGFDPGFISGKIRLNMPNPRLNVSFPFAGVEKVNATVYKFLDAPFTMTVRNENVIMVQYMDEKGMPTSYVLVSLAKNIGDVIQKEKERRLSVYNTIVAFGPEFKSTNYGSINFDDENTFKWNGYSRLITSKIIPSGTNGQGSVKIKYFTSKSLAVQFDGILTFVFQHTNEEVNFLYKIESDGLRLESLAGYRIKNGFVSSRDTNPLVMFFARVEKKK